MNILSNEDRQWIAEDLANTLPVESSTQSTKLFSDLIAALQSAQFSTTCCDKPEDRMWHAADNTWWKRIGNKWTSAEPPKGWTFNATTPT